MFTSLWHIGGLNFWLRVQRHAWCVIFFKNIAMTSLGALLTHLFWNWKKLNLLESPFVAAAGFQLFISGPTRTTVYDKLSAFFQRDFLAYVNLSDFVLIFSVKLKLSKSTELLHFHEFFGSVLNFLVKSNCYL